MLESDKVPAHCISLATPLGERIFVRRGETRLRWLLSWWHTISIAHNDVHWMAGQKISCQTTFLQLHLARIATPSTALHEAIWAD